MDKIPPEPPAQRKKILIADDDERFLGIQAVFLSQEGYGVSCAQNGLIAYQLCQSSRFDVIILDIKMPLMNGVKAVKAIRQLHPLVPIIILSGEGEEHEIKEALESGADLYVPKPCGLTHLLEIIKEVGQKKKAGGNKAIE